MPFADKETSLIESRPEELYLFVQGGTYWAQNSGTTEISYGGKVWLPKGIKRSNKKLNSNSLKSKMVLTTALSNEFTHPYLTCAPNGMIEFTLYRGQWDDYIPYFRGFVEGVSFQPNEIEITCSPMTSRLRRCGLRRRYSRHCNVPFCHNRCTLSEGTYEVLGTIDSVSGLSIASSDFATKADGYFKGGYVEANGYSRMMVYHVTDTVKLNSPIPNLAGGMNFNAKRGCDHSRATCISLANILNFQGHPWLPYKNPFTGDGIA